MIAVRLRRFMTSSALWLDGKPLVMGHGRMSNEKATEVGLCAYIMIIRTIRYRCLIPQLRSDANVLSFNALLQLIICLQALFVEDILTPCD